MTAWEGINRRKFPRVKFPCLIMIQCGQDKQDMFLTHTENIGVGGACVILKKPLKIFSPVAVELDLLDFAEHIKCRGKVVWSVRRRDPDDRKPDFFDTGIEFEGLEGDDLDRLEGVVQRLVQKGELAA